MKVTGTLPMSTRAADTAALLAAIKDTRDGGGGLDTTMRLLRNAAVWVETEPVEDGHTVRAVDVQGLRWLPVFTSLAQLGVFAQASGRGDQEIHYGQLSGAEVLDVCLPALPHGTGVVLDPASEHVFALPPVAGIVADSLAVDLDGEG